MQKEGVGVGVVEGGKGKDPEVAPELRGEDKGRCGISRCRHIVIALSAALNNNILALTEQAGFDACLAKPVHISTLFETLDRVRKENM